LALPSSRTTHCHGAFYATDVREQCFQFHMPTPNMNNHTNNKKTTTNNGDSENDDGDDDSTTSILHAIWDPLNSQLCQEECHGLAQLLADDGWNEEKYLQPLRHAEKAIKVPFALLEPHLETYVYHQRIVLVGDAAHPPVPYLGQGAQQGLEDAGTLALLLKGMHVIASVDNDNNSFFDSVSLDRALQLYDTMRVPRTRDILERSKEHGLMQQKRADSRNRRHARAREEQLQRDVFFHETLEDVLPGATYDYKQAVNQTLKEEPLGVIVESDDDDRLVEEVVHAS